MILLMHSVTVSTAFDSASCSASGRSSMPYSFVYGSSASHMASQTRDLQISMSSDLLIVSTSHVVPCHECGGGSRCRYRHYECSQSHCYHVRTSHPKTTDTPFSSARYLTGASIAAHTFSARTCPIVSTSSAIACIKSRSPYLHPVHVRHIVYAMRSDSSLLMLCTFLPCGGEFPPRVVSWLFQFVPEVDVDCRLKACGELIRA